MKFHKQSIFTKYNIEPNVSQQKLMILFQTDPLKRKDLPLIISILKDKKKLFEEELYTICDNAEKGSIDEIRSTLLTNAYTLIENKYSNFNELMDCYHQFDIKKDACSTMFYAQEISDGEINNIILDFEHSILEYAVESALSDIEEIDSDLLSIILDELSGTEYILKFEESISNKIELAFSKAENENLMKKNLEFVSSLPSELLKNDEISKSINYYVKESFLKNEDLYFINENYINVFKLLDVPTASEKSNILINIAHEIMDLEADKPEDYLKYKNATNKLIDNYCFYIENFEQMNSDFDKDEFELCIKILDAFHRNNESWYKKYRKNMKSLDYYSDASEIYEVVQTVIKGGFDKSTYFVFSNVISRKIGVEHKLDKWSKRNDFLSSIIGLLKLKGNMRFSYNDIISLDDYENSYNTPSNVDNLLCELCFLRYLNPDVLNDTAIQNIKTSAFGLLNFLDCAGDSMNIGPYYSELTYKGIYIKDVVSHCPSDWYIGDKTVSSYLYSLGNGYRSSYGTSNFSSINARYRELIDSAYSYTHNLKSTEKITNARNTIKDYQRAVKLYNSENYNDALSIFKKIQNYKDSKLYVKQCTNKIYEKQYNEACECLKNKKFDEGINICNNIENKYRPASKLKIQIEKAKKQFEYTNAYNLFASEKYSEAYEIFNKINPFLNSSEMMDKCISNINENKYKKGEALFNNKQYSVAYSIFDELQDYKESRYFASKCSEFLIEEKYINAKKLFDDGDYSKAIDAFINLGEYKDSKEMVDLSTSKHKEKIYRTTYDKANRLLQNAKVALYYKKDIEKSIELLSKIDNEYKNVNELKNEAEEKLRKILLLKKIFVASFAIVGIGLICLFITIIVLTNISKKYVTTTAKVESITAYNYPEYKVEIVYFNEQKEKYGYYISTKNISKYSINSSFEIMYKIDDEKCFKTKDKFLTIFIVNFVQDSALILSGITIAIVYNYKLKEN